MPRPKGSKNKPANNLPPSSLLSPKERVVFIAELIVERMNRDQSLGQTALKQAKAD